MGQRPSDRKVGKQREAVDSRTSSVFVGVIGHYVVGSGHLADLAVVAPQMRFDDEVVGPRNWEELEIDSSAAAGHRTDMQGQEEAAVGGVVEIGREEC